MITFDDKELLKLQRSLQVFRERAYPFATKATINRAAFETQRVGRATLEQRFTLRNKFTVQSVRVNTARGLVVSQQEAVVGSTQDYLRVQEFGGVKVGKGASKLSIPTGFSAGQRGQKPRTRMPRRPNAMKNIKLRGSRGATNAAKVHEAKRSGNKYIFMDLGRRKGLFKVTGSKKKPKVNMVQDLTRRSVQLTAHPWLGPASRLISRRIPQYYKEALQFQANRHKLFN